MPAAKLILFDIIKIGLGMFLRFSVSWIFVKEF